MPYSIKLAGQDITQYVDQMSVVIDDTLGQGAGAGSGTSTQGRASTVKLNTTLGPMNTAVGAGQNVLTPVTTSVPRTTTMLQDTFARVDDPTSWDIANTGGTWSQGGGGTASISGNTGQITGVTTNVRMFLANVTLDGSDQGTDYYCTVKVSALGDKAGILFYGSGSSAASYYLCWLHTNDNTLAVSKSVSGTVTTLASTPFSATANTYYKIHLNVVGTTFSARVWLATASEPTTWQVTVTDATYTTGYGGLVVQNNVATDVSSFVSFQATHTALVTQTTYQSPTVPLLVRQGEIIITDTTNTIVFGGFATKYTDTSTSVLGQTKQNFTTVEGIDYSTSLQRTLVNEVFTGATDIYIIQYVMNKYVGWVNLQYLPTNPGYTFATKNFRNVSVEQVIQTVAGITGYLVFVDYLKNLHYVSPTTASSAPFNLSSVPDFVTTFPHAVEEYLIDDNSAINRVFFYGGTKTSVDFWQDISPLANGNNVTFPLAYYPSPMSDGKYHLKINGVDSTISTSTSSGAAGQFVSQGGTATALIDPGAKAITFDTGYAPAAGATVLAGYRYSFPLSLIITDEGSHRYYGGAYLDGSIDDNTIFDITTAIQRCKVLLSQQSYGLLTLKLEVYNKPGVQAGMLIHVYNQLRGINATYLVQEVQTEPLGAGNFVYHLTLGAWNWNLIDFLMKLPTLATFQDNQSETQETVNIVQVLTNVNVHDAWSSKISTQGLYYARATAVGDGHDAYPGFSTVTS